MSNLRNKICKLCYEENCISEYVKNVTICKKCNSIYANLDEGVFPNITSINNSIKVKIQKKLAKILAESYVEYLKLNEGLSITNMLDIGAGHGMLVALLRKKGIKSEGIESDENTVKHSNSNITHAFFDKNYSTEQKYDLITINQCLYYFHNQFEIIEKMSKMLKNNGRILISNVNPESIFRLEHHIWTQGCRVVLGSPIFHNLDKFNLKCQNITSYDDNLYKDYFLHKNGKMHNEKFWTNMILYTLKIKKMINMNKNGINNFILLQKFK
jgi:2-polyprenyl-3-methyl-5-hydroxy-6-metoxy-1,4-benzoquinol methylase